MLTRVLFAVANLLVELALHSKQYLVQIERKVFKQQLTTDLLDPLHYQICINAQLIYCQYTLYYSSNCVHMPLKKLEDDV